MAKIGGNKSFVWARRKIFEEDLLWPKWDIWDIWAQNQLF